MVIHGLNNNMLFYNYLKKSEQFLIC